MPRGLAAPRPGGRAAVRAAVVDADGAPLDGALWADLEAEAREEAAELGLEIAAIEFGKGRLSVVASGDVDALQALNSHISAFIDAREADDEVARLPPFLLEVSSPGLSCVLRSDADFAAFKGFEVEVGTTEPFKGKTEWRGTLVGRDDEWLSLNLKGRPVKLPIALVTDVRLPAAKSEKGDPYG